MENIRPFLSAAQKASLLVLLKNAHNLFIFNLHIPKNHYVIFFPIKCLEILIQYRLLLRRNLAKFPSKFER